MPLQHELLPCLTLKITSGTSLSLLPKCISTLHYFLRSPIVWVSCSFPVMVLFTLQPTIFQVAWFVGRKRIHRRAFFVSWTVAPISSNGPVKLKAKFINSRHKKSSNLFSFIPLNSLAYPQMTREQKSSIVWYLIIPCNFVVHVNDNTTQILNYSEYLNVFFCYGQLPWICSPFVLFLVDNHL